MLFSILILKIMINRKEFIITYELPTKFAIMWDVLGIQYSWCA